MGERFRLLLRRLDGDGEVEVSSETRDAPPTDGEAADEREWDLLVAESLRRTLEGASHSGGGSARTTSPLSGRGLLPSHSVSIRSIWAARARGCARLSCARRTSRPATKSSAIILARSLGEKSLGRFGIMLCLRA